MIIFDEIRAKILLLESEAKNDLHALVCKAEALAKTQAAIFGGIGLVVGLILGFLLRG